MSFGHRLTSRFDGGVIIVDHSASPGLPEDIARAAGYDPKLCGPGKVYEAATMTCAHCKTCLVKNPMRVRERAYCAKCGGQFICDFCHIASLEPTYSHLPFEKLRDNLLKSAERALTLGSPPALLDLNKP